MMEWWILVLMLSGDSGMAQLPRALGPYPSLELCRQAGYQMFTDDARFWTEEYRQKRADRRARAAAQLRSLPLGKWQTLRNGEKWLLDTKGNITGPAHEMGGTATMLTPRREYPLNALTDCVPIKRP